MLRRTEEERSYEESEEMFFSLRGREVEIKAPLLKEIQEEALKWMLGQNAKFLEVVYDYYLYLADEFFNEMRSEIREKMSQQTKQLGIILTSLSLLVSVVLSTYLFTINPDVGRLFIYPAVFSLLMLVLLLFKKEGNSIGE